MYACRTNVEFLNCYLFNSILYVNILLRTFFETIQTIFDQNFNTTTMWNANIGLWTNSDGHYITKDYAGSWDNSFLIGVWSKHSNSTEDRVFKFYYARSSSYDLGNCYSTNPNTGGAINITT